MTTTPMEAECKFRVRDAADIRVRLKELGAAYVRREVHRDTYLRHPSRDFRETDEALRIREVGREPFITYKGPRLDGPIKIRPEIELAMVPGTVDDWLKIWGHLGFVVALMVPKTREIYSLEHNHLLMTITLDHVESIGYFAEIERMVNGSAEIAQAQKDIQKVGQLLGLSDVEPRSYLGLLLSKKEQNQNQTT